MIRPPSEWLGSLTRYRLAIVLLALTLAVLGSKLVEDVFIERLRQDCSSLFLDRLRPATMLFHLGDRMHLKEKAIAAYLSEPAPGDAGALQYALGQHDGRIEQILSEFDQTYLVGNESEYLRDLRLALAEYRATEEDLIRRRRSGQPASVDRLDEPFSKVRQQLLVLSKLQEDVGQELERDSEASASGVTGLLYFQLGVAFVLGLIAAWLASSLGTSRSSKPPRDPRLH